MKMFDEGTDLPLFSKTAPRSHADTFKPQASTANGKLFACPICFDTGEVMTKRGKIVQCPCGAGK